MAKRSLVGRMRELSTKFVTRATNAQPDYVNEVSRPETWDRWKANASAAAPTYNAAMAEVIARGSWGAGIANTDPRTYGELTRAKAGRRVEGLKLTGGKWLTNFAPIAQAIDETRATLPPRGTKMSDANIGRAVSMMRAVHDASQARRGRSASPIGAAYPTTGVGVGMPTVQGFSAPASAEYQRPQVGSYLSSLGQDYGTY